MEFAIRAAVMSTIAIAYYLTRGFGSFVDTFVMVFIASLASQLVVLGLRSLRNRGNPPAPVTLIVIAGALIVAIGVLVLVVGHGRHRGPLAYRTVEELVADPVLDDELKLHGYVELHSMTASIQHDQAIHTFVLTTHQRRLAVRFVGPAPDTLQERAEVIATGRLTRGADGTYLFEATDVIAKCPSTYNTAAGPVPASRFR